MPRLAELSGGRRRRTALCLGFACAATLSHAAAQSRLELTWDAPPECPQGPAVRQKVDALLGSAARKTGQLRASGRIVRNEGRYRLILTVQEQNRPRNRTIDAETCDDLAGAAAVALGLLLRAESGTAAADTSPADATAPNGANDTKSTSDTNAANTRTATDAQSAARDASKNPTASATKTPAAASAAATRSDNTPETPTDKGGAATPRRWRVLLRAPVVHFDVARLPKPSVGLGAGAGFRYDDFSVGVSGRVYYSQTLWSNLATPDAGAVANRVALEAWACQGFRSGALELAPCLSVGVDHVVTRGTGTDVKPQSARSSSILIGVAGAGKLYLANWLAVVATATLALETARPKLTITSLGEVQQLGPVAVSLALGPEWIF